MKSFNCCWAVGLSPHLDKTVHMAWGLAANLWNFMTIKHSDPGQLGNPDIGSLAACHSYIRYKD